MPKLEMPKPVQYRTRNGLLVNIWPSDWPNLAVGDIDIPGEEPRRLLWNISDGTHGDRDSKNPCISNLPEFDLVEKIDA